MNNPFVILLLAFILLPLIVILLQDFDGCTRNCRQGPACDCQRSKG